MSGNLISCSTLYSKTYCLTRPVFSNLLVFCFFLNFPTWHEIVDYHFFFVEFITFSSFKCFIIFLRNYNYQNTKIFILLISLQVISKVLKKKNQEILRTHLKIPRMIPFLLHSFCDYNNILQKVTEWKTDVHNLCGKTLFYFPQHTRYSIV